MLSALLIAVFKTLAFHFISLICTTFHVQLLILETIQSEKSQAQL